MKKKRPTISACMITLNESRFINRCLRNITPFVDEIIIIDGGSKDSTAEIAERYSAKVVFHRWPDDFSQQRNVSLRRATKDWILIVDPDEKFSHKLLTSLRSLAGNNVGIDMVAFPRKNYIDGKRMPDDRQLRFFPNRSGIRYQGAVHEKPMGWKRVLIATDFHIIHRKSSDRQRAQNSHYAKLIKVRGRGPFTKDLI